jgi:mannose-6-phosphate isomerase-like protein (cupin superfamily)
MPWTHVPARATYRPDKLAKINLFDEPELFLDLYCLEPGQQQAPHTHAANAKVYYVLEGVGTFLVGGREERLGPGAAVLAPAGELHGVRNEGPDRLALLVTMAPNPNRIASATP